MLNDIVLDCVQACQFFVNNLKRYNDENNISFSDESFRSLTYIRTTYVQRLELISYGMARLCLVIPQPSQFLLRLCIDHCTKKVVTLRLNISGI